MRSDPLQAIASRLGAVCVLLFCLLLVAIGNLPKAPSGLDLVRLTDTSGRPVDIAASQITQIGLPIVGLNAPRTRAVVYLSSNGHQDVLESREEIEALLKKNAS